MAIKKLQSNFTTPEQSNRLMELGVPADSADCYINGICNNRAFQLPDIFSKCAWLPNKKPIPCWSVGRLIEIIALCGQTYPYKQRWSPNMVQDIVELMEDIIHELNFSNLEEPEV